MNKRGFTLIEVMAAFAVMAIVFGMLFKLATGVLHFSHENSQRSINHRVLQGVKGEWREWVKSHNHINPLPMGVSSGDAHVQIDVGSITFQSGAEKRTIELPPRAVCRLFSEADQAGPIWVLAIDVVRQNGGLVGTNHHYFVARQHGGGVDEKL